MDTKKCTRCHKSKILDMFYQNRTGAYCKACMSERSAEWRRANPERARQLKDRWAKANIEKVRQLDNIWRKANPEKVRQSNDRWQKANPEKVRQYTFKYRYGDFGPVFRLFTDLKKKNLTNKD